MDEQKKIALQQVHFCGSQNALYTSAIFLLFVYYAQYLRY